MTHDEMIAVIAAHKEGKRIQIKFKDSDSWDNSQAHWSTAPGFNFDRFDYRVAPEPRLRPWTPEEVPMPCILKNVVSGNRYAVLAVFQDGLISVNRASFCHCPFADLVASTQHSTDGGVTWKPCGVEE